MSPSMPLIAFLQFTHARLQDNACAMSHDSYFGSNLLCLELTRIAICYKVCIYIVHVHVRVQRICSLTVVLYLKDCTVLTLRNLSTILRPRAPPPPLLERVSMTPLPPLDNTVTSPPPLEGENDTASSPPSCVRVGHIPPFSKYTYMYMYLYSSNTTCSCTS